MPWPTCDVCGEPACGVACSATGPISFAYCVVCLQVGADVPGALASAIACCGGPEHTDPYLLDMIEPSLARAGMTREAFDAMVADMTREMDAYEGRAPEDWTPPEGDTFEELLGEDF